MAARVAPASPQWYARAGGALYLYVIVAAMFAEVFVRGRLVDRHDAVATAHNIMAAESQFRLAGVADTLVFVCDVALAWIFYVLLRPTSRELSLLAAMLRLVYAAIVGANTALHFAALFVVRGGPSVASIPDAQRDGLALLFLRVHGAGFAIALVFFGVHCIVLGYLVLRSTYLPATIGALLTIGGACYVLNSIIDLAAPAVNLPDAVLLPGFVAELSLCAWLIVMGVNVSRWNARTGGAGESPDGATASSPARPAVRRAP